MMVVRQRKEGINRRQSAGRQGKSAKTVGKGSNQEHCVPEGKNYLGLGERRGEPGTGLVGSKTGERKKTAKHPKFGPGGVGLRNQKTKR